MKTQLLKACSRTQIKKKKEKKKNEESNPVFPVFKAWLRCLPAGFGQRFRTTLQSKETRKKKAILKFTICLALCFSYIFCFWHWEVVIRGEQNENGGVEDPRFTNFSLYHLPRNTNAWQHFPSPPFNAYDAQLQSLCFSFLYTPYILFWKNVP